MSTRSVIAQEQGDGSIKAVYCHWDGYPSNNGKLLQEHYQDSCKVAQLIELGSLSTLGPEIGEAHPFDFADFRSNQDEEHPFAETETIESNIYGQPNTFTRFYKYPTEQRAEWDKMCLAYRRDRGDECDPPKRYPNFDFFSADIRNRNGTFSWCEYAYVFRSGVWYVCPMNGAWSELSSVLAKEEVTA